jgi:hypothetical protein
MANLAIVAMATTAELEHWNDGIMGLWANGTMAYLMPLSTFKQRMLESEHFLFKINIPIFHYSTGE